jgi:hypothetical protein
VGAKDIQEGDIVIVMWTYMSRLSLQWPARTTVPFANIVDPNFGWKTIMVGFNRLFGLDRSDSSSPESDQIIQDYIETATKQTYLDPMGVYNRYYNSMVLQQTTDGLLRSTGANILHLSVEPDKLTLQLELARQELDVSLRDPYTIPHPDSWYDISVDHTSSIVLHDTSIPPADNGTHPSVEHHQNFAQHLYQEYFQQ